MASNSTCHLCSKRQATTFCRCTDPPTSLCDSCTETHEVKLPSTLHPKVSIPALEALMGGKNALRRSVEMMEECGREVANSVDRVVEYLQQYKEWWVMLMRSEREKVVVLLEAAEREVEYCVMKGTVPFNPLARALCSLPSEELSIFEYSVTPPDLQTSCQAWATYSLTLQALIDQFSALPPASNPQSQLSLSRSQSSAKPSKVEIGKKPWTVRDVLCIQQAFKSYIERMRLERLKGEMIDFPDSPNIAPDHSTEIACWDIISLLSEPAQATYRRLFPLVLQRQVRDVAILGPRKLTASGDVYIGQWAVRRDGRPCRKGKGKLVTFAGALVEGYWKDGKLHLLGRIIYPNGDYYEGPFVDGIRSGKGRFETYEAKIVFTGDWENDMRQGYGLEIFEDGSRYEGAFQAESKTGKGTFQWKDGSSYTGEFVEGRFEGFGIYVWFDGRRYEGCWRNGKMNGKGKFTFKDGKCYEGEYLDDKKHGYGVYVWEGQKYEGDWFQGKMHGFGYHTTGAGRKRFEFRDGNKVKAVPE